MTPFDVFRYNKQNWYYLAEQAHAGLSNQFKFISLCLNKTEI